MCWLFDRDVVSLCETYQLETGDRDDYRVLSYATDKALECAVVFLSHKIFDEEALNTVYAELARRMES